MVALVYVIPVWSCNSTIGHEKSTNARVACKSLAEFVAIMDGLNLPQPKRIAEAVPAKFHP